MDNKKFEYYRDQYVGEGLTKNYAACRPTFSDTLYEMIGDFCDEATDTKNRNELALDVGCGPGTNSIQLTKRFKKVIGVDVSIDQLNNAPIDVPGLTFKHARGEHLHFIEANSVDLITNAESLHWLPIEEYYTEVERVLKPGGTFAVFAYIDYMNITTRDKEIKEYLQHIFNNVLDQHFEDCDKTCHSSYYLLPQPFNGWERKEYLMTYTACNVSGFLGLLKSYNAFVNFSKRNPDRNLEMEILHKLKAHGYSVEEDYMKEQEAVFKISMPTFLLMARKPE